MGGLRTLALTLWLCTLSADRIRPTGTGDVSPEVEAPAVRMALTAFSVDDESLELSYKIVNGFGHDVWVCHGVGFSDTPDVKKPEVYVDQDGRTLVIRERIDVPLQGACLYARAQEGRFVRIPAGQDRIESLEFDVPVRPEFVLGGGADNGRCTRLVFEIGFYDGDLPGTIRTILRMSDELNCGKTAVSGLGTFDIYARYFGGLSISAAYGGLSGFDSSWSEGGDEIMIPYLWPVVLGESSLTVVVDGVFIPYTRY